MLSFIAGDVPSLQSHEPPSVRSEQSLAAVARQVRNFHDLTAGTDLASGHEVVCHNDLSPRNTVYRDAGGQLLPVAFIDWDIAAPGARIHDVPHVCWQYVRLGPGVRNAPPRPASPRWSGSASPERPMPYTRLMTGPSVTTTCSAEPSCRRSGSPCRSLDIHTMCTV